MEARMLLTWLMISSGLTVAMMVYLILSPRQLLAARFGRYAAVGPVGKGQSPLATRWYAPFVLAVAPRMERLLPGSYLERVRAELRMAGLYGPAQFQGYLALQAALTLGGVFLGVSVLGRHSPLVMGLCLGALGAFLPWFTLLQAKTKRQAAINSSLPDTMDLMTASVEAGLGLDAAIAQMTRRASKSCVALNQEFSRYLQEVQLGVARYEALKGLGARSGVEDLRHVVTALMQGDALGVGVSQILRAQAQHLRLRRKQIAEEKAMKTPIKILFPLVMFIFPSMFVVILGPGMLQILDNFVHRM
jgi:tight adherence protein C